MAASGLGIQATNFKSQNATTPQLHTPILLPAAHASYQKPKMATPTCLPDRYLSQTHLDELFNGTYSPHGVSANFSHGLE